ITLRWPEVGINSSKAVSITYALNLVLQIGTDGIHGATCQASSQSVIRPGTIGIYAFRPGRIAGHTIDVFNHVRTTHVAPEPHAERCFAIPKDIPGQSHARLEARVIG